MVPYLSLTFSDLWSPEVMPDIILSDVLKIYPSQTTHARTMLLIGG